MAGYLEGPAPDERSQPEGRRNDQGIRIDPEAEAQPTHRRSVISAVVWHEPGVLAKVSGLFSRRQFNIESLAVGPTENDEYARITMVVEESEPGLEQVKKQLDKQVPVVSVTELGQDAVERELALVKVGAAEPEAVQAVTEMFDGRVAEAGPDTITVELTGPEDEIDTALETFQRFTIHEIARTGSTALESGAALTGTEVSE